MCLFRVFFSLKSRLNGHVAKLARTIFNVLPRGTAFISARGKRSYPRTPNILTPYCLKLWPQEDKSKFFRGDILGLRVDRFGLGLEFRDEIYPQGVKVLTVDPNEDNINDQHSRPFTRPEDLKLSGFFRKQAK